MSDLYEKLKALYGEEFARKYLAKRRSAMSALTPEQLEEVKKFADEHIPQSDDFAVKWNGYNVLFVETPDRADLREPKPTSGANWRALVLWEGSPYDSNFVTVFAPEEEAKKLARKGFFYLIGRLKERQYNGKPSLVFNAVAVIEVAVVEKEILDEEIEEFFSDEDFEVEEIEVGRV